MVTIYRPRAATMNPITSGRPTDRCEDLPYTGEPSWARLVMDKFLTNRNVVHFTGVPPLNMSSPLWSGSNNGAWWVSGGYTPPLKVDAGFTRPKPKSQRSFKAFEALKREGKIVVSPRSVGSITVKDQLSISSGKLWPGTWKNPIYSPVLQTLKKEAWNPCRNAFFPSLPLTESLNYFPGNMYDQDVIGTHSIMGEYEAYTDAQVSTLLTDIGPEVGYAIRDILSAYGSLESNAAVATSMAAELNDAIFDITTELAELPTTVAMIFEAIKKALIYYKETRHKVTLLKRRSKNPVDLLDEIAELWLTYRYGIQPIVYSVTDAMAYLEQSGVIFRTVRKGSNHAVPVESHGWTFSGHLDIRERFWGKGRYSASTTSGLGFNPLVTAWELVPLSFVVDWFLNIGDLLSALTPSMSYDQKVMTRSTQCKQTLIGRHTSGNTVPFVVDLYDLNPINPIDHIGLSFDHLLSTKQALDGLSLAWLLFLKDFRRILYA